ncbi:winged helix-turn-helix domain-containing protein [Streptomyces sp.]|uniref:winged helix-turn-helix domain-containing protein n=1 Tax=Streptomyces sp. TaxID=1931 RepID=UPI002F955D44
MIRIRLTAEDFARVRFAARPAPLQELNTALGMLVRRDDGLLHGRWRQRLLRTLPAAMEPLGDLVPAGRPPLFLDVFEDTLEDAQEAMRATPSVFVRSELARVYASHPAPPPLWLRGLHRGDADAWRVLRRAQRAAFDTVLGPVWPLVQDLHRAEFTRHAMTVAEHGVAAALADAVPGSTVRDGVWELDGPDQAVELDGQGLLLVPSFHWTGRPLLAFPPGRPAVVTYPAGPGHPLPAEAGAEDPLAAVLGRTRLDVLQLLDREHTTSDVARRLRVSNATASAHASALRGAGLITTVRAGRAVLHRRTALGSLLVGVRDPGGRPGRPIG